MTSGAAKRKPPKQVSQSTLDHFSAHPLAHPTLQDPSFRIVPMSRTLTHGGRGHTLMAKTWNSDTTIRELLSLSRPATATTEAAELRRFYTFGTDLNAHPDLLHGGVVASILDSSLGGVIGMAFRESDDAAAAQRFTVQLNVTYKQPVRTPGTIMVRSWVRRAEGEGGRKVWAEGVVESQGADGGKVVNARAEGMWLKAKAKAKSKM